MLKKLVLVLLSLALMLLVLPVGVGAFYVPTESMADTLRPGDMLFINKLPPHNPQLNDLVVFRNPKAESSYFIKRVVGLPGDRIKMVDKMLYRNGRPINEPWARHNTTFIDEQRDNIRTEFTVPAGHYYVMGDNRDNSLDSRYFGPIPESSITGKPVFRYWPQPFAKVR